MAAPGAAISGKFAVFAFSASSASKARKSEKSESSVNPASTRNFFAKIIKIEFSEILWTSMKIQKN